MAQAPTTQCPFCGGTLTVYGDFCPHCGSKKQQFQEHREKMNAYQNEFESTKEGVVKENRRDSKKAGAIATLAVLVALILVMIVMTANAYGIGKIISSNQTMKKANSHLSKLQEYEANGDFYGFENYWYQNEINYVQDKAPFLQYKMMSRFAGDYKGFSQSFSRYIAWDNTSYYADDIDSLKKHLEGQISAMASYYVAFYRLYDDCITNYDPDFKYNYYPSECYSEERLHSIELMSEYMDSMVSYYFDIPAEEIESLRKLSEAKLSAKLIDQMENQIESGKLNLLSESEAENE